MFDVQITAPAESDIQQNFVWWRDNRDPDQAAQWYDSIYPAIESLRNMPRRCALAREHEMYSGELRQLHFGVGRRTTHRIVFAIEGETVFILAVLHQRQQGFAI